MNEAYKFCPSCSMKIPITAMKCPYCHENVTAGDPQGDSPSGMIAVMIMGLLFALIFGIWGISIDMLGPMYPAIILGILMFIFGLYRFYQLKKGIKNSFFDVDYIEPSSYDSSEEDEDDYSSDEDKKLAKFYTNKGEYFVADVLSNCYQKGLGEGAQDKRFGNGEHQWNFGTEIRFKEYWISHYGIPSGKDRNIYKEALSQYINGYKDGYNF